MHWAVFAAAFLFFAWNPPWAGAVMVFYGLAANLPCIIALRYNRIRLLRIAARGEPGYSQSIAAGTNMPR